MTDQLNKFKKGILMKKIILACLMMSSVFAYEVTNEFWIDKSGTDRNKQINITCSNGVKGYVYYFPHVEGYYAKNSNNKYSSLNSAVSKVCSQGSSNVVKKTVLKDSFICDTESSIKRALKGRLSFSSANFDVSFIGPSGKPNPTDYKDCFTISQNYRTTVVKSYPAGKLIDGYYKVKDDRGNILYVRKSTVK